MIEKIKWGGGGAKTFEKQFCKFDYLNTLSKCKENPPKFENNFNGWLSDTWKLKLFTGNGGVKRTKSLYPIIIYFSLLERIYCIVL